MKESERNLRRRVVGCGPGEWAARPGWWHGRIDAMRTIGRLGGS
ncbi:hypothetical protein [Amycolatopsis kentuckyensis]|nr:hypothetical protein [Amycolatopsis kentuckyensis]